MITKQTAVNQIEITKNGTVQVRIGLEIVDNGNITHQKWHRTSLPPGYDVDLQFAMVNANLAQMNELPVSQADIDRVRTQCVAAWTPAVVQSYQASLAV